MNEMIVFQFKLEFYQSILTTSEFNEKETTGIFLDKILVV